MGAAAVPIALIVSTAIAAGTTQSQINAQDEAAGRQKDADKQAKKDRDQALADAQKQQDDLAKKQAEDEVSTEALLNRDSSRSRQKAQGGGTYGRSDTILTSPLGVTGQPQVAGKTLLGQ